jgi:geranylgeranyl diphosphate synthase, type I
MAESTRLVDLVQDRLDGFFDEQSTGLAAIAPELDPFVSFSRDLLAGGKRFRALFAYWGWRSVSSRRDAFDPLAERGLDDLEAIVTACTALEVFHAAALVHDDLIDNSDTRRGLPAAHRRFEALHRDAGWRGRPVGYGRAAAVLLGDLLLGWSDELLDAALPLVDRESARVARIEFVRMRTEVTAGQYLDILEEHAWAAADEKEQLRRAHRVILYKSAKYSVEAPLALGAALAGGTAEQLDGLRAYGVPLGVAFQLRDDLLGVFGDSERTGKPTGDDLREGKRTVLVALARPGLPLNARALLDELLGDPELDGEQITMLQTAIRDSGAVERVEAMIDRNVDQALASLEDSGLSSSARAQLTELARTVTQRVA